MAHICRYQRHLEQQWLLQLNTQYQCFGITTGAGELKYIPAEQLFSASAWMDMYYGALTGTVKLNASQITLMATLE